MCITVVDLIVTWSKELDTMTINIGVDETLLEENTKMLNVKYKDIAIYLLPS